MPFAATVVLTLVPFLVGQCAIKRQLGLAERYYLKGEKKALQAKNRSAPVVIALAVLGGTAFTPAVALSIVFAKAHL